MHGIVLVSLEPKISIEPALLWGMKVLAILAASYFFYLIIERPAHQFARVMSYRFAGQPSR
jgi:peptidoglycan/LPS O-acetylase OafA/YrhL